MVFNEPNIRLWLLRYRDDNVLFDNNVYFVDVPGTGPGEKGSIEFTTCLSSADRGCKYKKCCVVWRWTVDFTGENTENEVTQVSSKCE